MNTATLPTTQARPDFLLSSPPTPDLEDWGDRAFEVVKGKRVEKHVGLIENFIANLLQERLVPFCRAQQLGRSVMETMFEIPGSGNQRKPDVAFVSFQTWAADRPLPRVNAWPVAPDLAVEVISPTDKAFDAIEKVQEYFAGGVRQVWHVYSNVEQVFVFDSPNSVKLLARSEELTVERVIPGFRLSLADLFPLSEPVE